MRTALLAGTPPPTPGAPIVASTETPTPAAAPALPTTGNDRIELITALAALSEISARDYILATLLGKFPSALIEVSIGHDLASYHDHMLRLTFFVLIAIGAYAAYIWQQKKGCRT